LQLQAAVLQKIKTEKRPVAAARKYWLDVWVDGPLLKTQPLPFTLPRMQLNVEGRKDYLRPELKLQFAEPLGLKLEPWQIPTNAITDPVASLILIRGFEPLLSRLPSTKSLSADPLPNQMTIWAMQEIPFETCVAIPHSDATNYLKRVGPALTSLINTNIEARNWAGHALWLTNNSVGLRGLPFLAPFLRATNGPTGDYLVGGIFAMPGEGKAFPWDDLMPSIRQSNIVYYDWELNGGRAIQWLPLSQLYQMTTREDVVGAESLGQKWMKAIEPKLKNCGTVVTLSAPNELSVVRNARLGLSGFELNWFSMWVDGLNFPFWKTGPAQP